MQGTVQGLRPRCSEVIIMKEPDWKKHLKAHLKDIELYGGHSKEDLKSIEKVVDFISTDRLHEIVDEFDIDELPKIIRLLELCEALDDERFREFAGNKLPGEDRICLPVKRSDLELLFLAVCDNIDERIIELASGVKQRAVASGKAKLRKIKL